MHKLLKSILLIASLLVIVIHFITSDDLSDFIRIYQYYTLQTNLIVSVVLSLSLLVDFNVLKPRAIYEKLLVGATLWIFVTGVLFHLLLSDLFHPVGLEVYSNFFEHTFVPFGLGIYILFIEDKMKLRMRDLWIFPTYPLLYSVVSLIRGHFTNFYPYWFLNPVYRYPHGWGSYLNQFYFLLGAMAVFLGFGLFYIIAHNLIRRMADDQTT